MYAAKCGCDGSSSVVVVVWGGRVGVVRRPVAAGVCGLQQLLKRRLMHCNPCQLTKHCSSQGLIGALTDNMDMRCIDQQGWCDGVWPVAT
jgi:hypothetical protein